MSERQLQIHLTAAGLTLLIFGGLWVLWTYPMVLVYLLLVILAAFTYSALYLILAAKMDPDRRPVQAAGPPQQTQPVQDTAESSRTESQS